MKKLFALLLTIILVFSIVACNSNSNFSTLEDDSSEKTNTSAQKTDSITEAKTESKTEVETEAETDAEPQAALIYKRFDDGTCLVTGIGNT